MAVVTRQVELCAVCGNPPTVRHGEIINWLVQCVDARCPGHNQLIGRRSRDAAIKRWNTIQNKIGV